MYVTAGNLRGTSALPRMKALTETHGSLGVATSAAISVACRSPTSPLFKHKLRKGFPDKSTPLPSPASSTPTEQELQVPPVRPPSRVHGLAKRPQAQGLCLDPNIGVWRAPLEPGVKSQTHSPEGHIPMFSTWSVLLGCLSVQVGIHQATGSEPRAGDLRPRLLCLRTGTSSLHSYPTGVHLGDRDPSGVPRGGQPLSVVFQKHYEQVLPCSSNGSPMEPSGWPGLKPRRPLPESPGSEGMKEANRYS